MNVVHLELMSLLSRAVSIKVKIELKTAQFVKCWNLSTCGDGGGGKRTVSSRTARVTQRNPVPKKPAFKQVKKGNEIDSLKSA